MANIVKKAVRGERKAMTSLYETNKQKVFYAAQKLLLKDEQAEKAAQWVWENIWNSAEQAGTSKEEDFTQLAVKMTADFCKKRIEEENAQAFYSIQNKEFTVECMADGLHIYENKVGVLTNNPPFETQMFLLNNYMNLSPKQPENNWSEELPLHTYSRGMGALGLPGDLSSASRFARVAYTKQNSVSGDSEQESVSQFFHILGSVDQQRGCCEVAEGKYEITIYTSCCNASRGIYYYTTYGNHQITAVDMHREDLDGSELIRYPLLEQGDVRWQN